MIWWMVFALLVVSRNLATMYFIPLTQRVNYQNCRKDLTCHLARALQEATWVTAAVEAIIKPSPPLPVGARVAGAGLFVTGSALLVWARKVNFCFLPTLFCVPLPLRCTSGPYSVLRHPGYYGLILSACGMVFLLGQVAAFFPALLYTCLLSYRITLEDKLLSR